MFSSTSINRRLCSLLSQVGAQTDNALATTGWTRARAENVAAPASDPWVGRAEDDGTCGASEGYPSWQSMTDLYGDRAAQQYLRAGCAVCPKHRVGNFAGAPLSGFERVFSSNTVEPAGHPHAPACPVGRRAPRSEGVQGGHCRAPCVDALPHTPTLSVWSMLEVADSLP